MTAEAISTAKKIPAVPAAKRYARLAIVGSFGGTHVGGSFWRAAESLSIEAVRFDVNEAARGSRVIRAALWRFAGRRPPRLNRFSTSVVTGCALARPEILIATGTAPLTLRTLRRLHDLGIRCINYSTDDPWNPTMSARWYLRALPEYDLIFTTRRSNMAEFTRIGCRQVRHLPFGYDEFLLRHSAHPAGVPAPDILFVGGADRDRIAFMAEFLRTGPRVALVGGYWERYSSMLPYALGQKPPEEVAALTVAAKVNLCLVRRDNRDGHVMRSFEIAALGGCMLVEDTAEHREIFGPDGEAVVYFRNAQEAAEWARALLANPAERARLAASVQTRITKSPNTYRDRLRSMLTTTEQTLTTFTSTGA